MKACAATQKPKVFITQLVEHPALNRTTQGIIDGLAQNGYKTDTNLDLRVESAQGNPALAAQIAAKFVGQAPDVVVAVSTLSAQSIAKYARDKKTKLVFSSVTDPMGADLVRNLDKPGNNTSGISNFVALEPQIQVFQHLQPHLNRLGFLYNPSEANSISLINKLKTVCKKAGITLVLQAAHNTAAVAQAATKLAASVDAIFVSNDSTALSALQVIINSARKVNVPVYVSDTDAVAQGALAALGPNQYKIGLQTAQMIVRVLNGKDVGQIPVGFPAHTELYLNADAANQLGIPLAKTLKSKAFKIIARGQS